MATKSNLRFLLSLGGQKIVIMQQHDRLQTYAGQFTERPNVSPARLSQAVESH